MSTPLRLGGFLLALLVVFIAARGVGAVTSPVDAPTESMDHGATGGETGGEQHTTPEPEEVHAPGGLQVAEQGYRLRVVDQRPVRLVIEGPDGAPVTAYDEVHDQPLHLVAVNRDLSGYDHVHPSLGDDGVWTIDLDLSPGTTRLIADFTPSEGPPLILGTDLAVAGDYRPAAPTPVTRTAEVAGYEVTLTGDLVPGQGSPVTATITRGGEPVTDLQPYLGAHGHLVALREGDLGYLHVHPEESDAGPEVPFVADVPSTGRYRLFLDFRHDGVVRTAAFTLEAVAHDH